MKKPERESIKATASPKTGQKTMKRSYQRAGVVASRTPLSSDTREVAVPFTSQTYQKLKLAADLKGVTIPVMVRQCVQYLLDPSDPSDA
jgi:hypothetical protein